MPNYQFVIDSSFKPFSLQELMVPYNAYKQEYEKSEDAYNELADKTDKFRYFSETLPESSRARQIYESYAKELQNSATDLAKNGLSAVNRRTLNNLRRRYQGEIGRLSAADDALQKELNRRRDNKDSSYLYANDILNIDDFLDNKSPNLYGISGNELYAKGAAAGKAISSRIYSSGDGGSALGGLYRKWVDTHGVSPENIGAFMQTDEIQQEIDKILETSNVTGNLTGANYNIARKDVADGIYNGLIYQESIKPMKDERIESPKERREREFKEEMTALRYGFKKDPQTGEWKFIGYDSDDSNYPDIQLPDGRIKIFDPTTRKYIFKKEGKPTKAGQAVQNIIDSNGVTNGVAIVGDINNGGTLSTTNISSAASQKYPPFYMDAWGDNAENPQEFDDGEKNSFTESDAKDFDYSKLHENAKVLARQYLRKKFPSIMEHLKDSQVDHIINNFMAHQWDEDALSDNHYRIMIPGTDVDGKVINTAEFNSFISRINQYKIDILNSRNGNSLSVEDTERGNSTNTDASNISAEEAAMLKFKKARQQN